MSRVTLQKDYNVGTTGVHHTVETPEEAAVADLTDSTTETPDNAVGDVSTVVTTFAHVDARLAVINQSHSNFADKINKCISALENHGLMVKS